SFLAMSLRPPTSPLFPYTTLFRSLYTAAVGHHFARPGNRFWPALHQSGFTSELISPFDERELLGLGVGISNVVPHATTSAAELRSEEHTSELQSLTNLVCRLLLEK